MCSAFRLEARVKIKVFALLYRSNTMTMTLVFSLLAVSTMLQGADSFSSGLSRRQTFAQTANVAGSIATAVAFPNLGANAEVTEETPRVVTRMGGLLESYQDGARGFKIMAPSGWNKFEGEVGAYDVKWQDLVDPAENIKISTSPVKSTTTSIDVLGNVQDVGKSLASKRNAELVKAQERLTEGILFYKFDFALKDGTRQLLQLCVNKGKIWSLDASAKQQRWPKREDLYENVLGSFIPKLN